MLEGIFTILQKSEKYYKIRLHDSTHPVFRAHFPDNPILPGFVLLEITATLFTQEHKEILRAKFLEQIAPLDVLELKSEEGEKSTKISATNNQVKVAEVVYAA
jgi:3-hydroxyacyl-[acyl-carrier-protein] dehydratase